MNETDSLYVCIVLGIAVACNFTAALIIWGNRTIST